MNTNSVTQPQVRKNYISSIIGGSAGEPRKPWETEAFDIADAQRLWSRSDRRSRQQSAIPEDSQEAKAKRFQERVAAGDIKALEAKARSDHFNAMLATRIICDGVLNSERAALAADLNQPKQEEVSSCQ